MSRIYALGLGQMGSVRLDWAYGSPLGGVSSEWAHKAAPMGLLRVVVVAVVVVVQKAVLNNEAPQELRQVEYLQPR